MELAHLVDELTNKSLKKQSRKKFLDLLNGFLKDSYSVKNVTYGEFDKEKHVFELQIMIPDKNNRILKLKNMALQSGFGASQYVQDLSLFVTRAFRQNKLWVTCKKSLVKGYRIDISKSRVHLDDPRKFNPKNQYGLNFWVQFKVLPKVTVKK